MWKRDVGTVKWITSVTKWNNVLIILSIFFQQYGSTSGESSPVKDGNASKSVLLFTTFEAFFDDDTSLDLFSLGLQKIHSDPNFLHFLEEV